MHTYSDLELRILNQIDNSYRVELTVNHEQELAVGHLDAAFLPWLPTADPAADGRRLFAWLFADEALKRAWAEARGQRGYRRVRLRIDADAPELHAIPWELLREEPDGEVANDLAATNATPFSRYLAGRWQPGSPVLTRPIRVLVAIAAPQNLAAYGLAPINPQQEFAALQEALAGLPLQLTQFPPPGHAFELPTADAETEPVTVATPTAPCTLAALETALKKGYHVLHVISHGHYNAEHQRAALFLADEQNQVRPVTDADFAAMLARQLADADVHNDNKLRLVFLASCQTAERSPADAFRGFAPQLVQAGVPAVLAMQDLVPVVTARAFATTFYRQLLTHGQVDLAANEARSHLLTARLPGAAIPVLFMRLRDGALLGKRGTIANDRPETFWPFVLKNITLGHCIPFLGPRINDGLLPSAAQIAEKLAKDFGYPLLADHHDLAKVTRYIDLRDPQLLRQEYTRILRRELFAYLDKKPTPEERRRYRTANLSETVAGVNWAEAVLAVHENELHHLLADLRLPLYMTTNVDSFMVEALRYKGLSPRRVGPRWEQVTSGTPQYTLQPPPSPESPVVFHLNGYDEDPEQHSQMVLTEDEYLTHFVRLARDHNYVLPMNIVRMLGESSFLFLGYSLDDWEFRVILQGLVNNLDRAAKLSVGVQLDETPNLETEKVLDYLGDYMGQYNIKIYWGTPQQFVNELHSEWQRHRGITADNMATDEAWEEEWDDDDW